MSAGTLFTVILLQGLVGTAIAVVGLYLLCKGRINLGQGTVSSALGVHSDEFSLDVSKVVSIKTRNPALGLLSIAMILLLIPSYLTRGDVQLVEVRGRLTGVEPAEVTTELVTEYWSRREPDFDGVVRGTISLTNRDVELHVVAPGFERGVGKKSLGRMSATTGTHDIGDIDVTTIVGPRKKRLSDVIGPAVTPAVVPAESLPSIGQEDWDAEE